MVVRLDIIRRTCTVFCGGFNPSSVRIDLNVEMMKPLWREKVYKQCKCIIKSHRVVFCNILKTSIRKSDVRIYKRHGFIL